jgi:hypothetical protein
MGTFLHSISTPCISAVVRCISFLTVNRLLLVFRGVPGRVGFPEDSRVFYGGFQVRTSTSRSCGGRSSPMCCVSCCACAAGSSGSCPALSASPAPAALTRLAVSATRPSRSVFVSSYSDACILLFDFSQIVPFRSLSFCVFFEVLVFAFFWVSEPSFTFH